ncbi:MAG: DNA mismatch repair protein MutS [Planctomycetaceae bacterium]|nr:DNA mismatch repair protein MutS [Planctomycetaceae bacterium]
MAKNGDTKLTPMMQRYAEVKAETPGSLLLFRMGDFYELFHEDAQIAAKVLGLTLTSRDKGSTNPVPMAGFPYHSLDGYLQKLIAAGHKAAICDQVEDPKTAKGLVRREVTRIITPGTLTDESLLDPKESNFVAAIAPAKDAIGFAWLELSTGRFQCEEVSRGVGSRQWGVGSGEEGEIDRASSLQGTQYSVLLDELTRIGPSEIILPESAQNDPALSTLNSQPSTLTQRPPWSFAANACRETLLKHFGTQTLEGFDLDGESPAITAAGALLEYVQETQRSSLGHITQLEPHRRGSSMLIDEATRRSLELTQTQRGGQREGSLLSVIDETVTSMGARLLADWLSNPLTDAVAINRRLDAVDELTCDSLLMRDVREQLEQAYDLQRLAGRVATLRASPRDLGSLARTLALLPKLKAKLAGRSSELLNTLEARLDLCPEVRSDIEVALVDDPPINVTDGGVIRSGYNSDLDELKDLARGGKQWIAQYQATQIERTGITSLKVGFNKVFGYYLGVTAANLDKVPDDYIRKQTLKNEERFVTPELKEYEEKVLRAEERAIALEQELFNALRERVCGETRRLQQTAETLARIDVLTALATLAVAQRYCRPTITDEPVLDIRDGRHPVLDRLQPTGEFVPNDVVLGSSVQSPESSEDELQDTGHSTLDTQHSTIALITGPNMAGKSTYIRQAALITVMAQMGSFVPAATATIGIADRVFARVGASDELGKGQSTFMVEMTETARILNTATERSLVILDEIGRGTSTYDGISLAWAITEYLHDEVRCRTLFATHYHELTELSQTLKQVANWNVAVHEQAGDVIFLHKIVPGAADRSYGIHVARIAGVPHGVISRAGVILDTLESDHHDKQGRPTIPARETTRDGARQLSLFGPEHHPLVDELKDLNLDNMTPLQAMQELARLREQVK